jgi:hypothetical protein
MRAPQQIVGTRVAEKGAFDPAFSDRKGEAGSIGARKIVVLQGYGFLPTSRHTNVLQIPTRFPTIIFAELVAKRASLYH